MRKRVRIFATAISVAFLCTGAFAVEPDFYLVMEKCTTTVGYLVLSDESLKTVEGTPVMNACSRAGKSISCRLTFSDNSKGRTAAYSVRFDSPPRLIFADDQSGDWFMIDTVAHAAVMITRVVDAQYAGSKVCQGGFFTQDEFKSLKR